MRRTIIAATAAATIIGGAIAVTASAQQEEKQRPQAQGQSQQLQQAPSPGDGAGKKSVPPAEGGMSAEPKATDKGGDRGGKAAQQREQTPKSEGKSTAQDRGAVPRQGTAEGRAEDADKNGTAQRKTDEADKKGTAQRKDDADAEKKGTAQRSDEKGGATAGRDAPDKDKQARKGSSQSVELSQEERTRIRTTIRQRNVRQVTNVNFSISVGTRVPRTVTLHALPREVLEIVPHYRGYRYFVISDRICIVDPATYEIVYIIDESGPPSHSARLVLTDSERQFVLSRLDLDRPSAIDVDIRLALGAEIPSRVEIHAFPDEIVATIPKLREYRYVVVDRRVAIVDPNGRDVALVIER
ncbi:MAG TPA: DUF1236 domain-containing protein [Hyphomicrobiaceae bacterium]|nr:DUF1236 domain-containing protein [Hyphomicrobiaceae bacterium]